MLGPVFSMATLTPVELVTFVSTARCRKVALNSLVELWAPSKVITVPVGIDEGSNGLTVFGSCFFASASDIETE